MSLTEAAHVSEWEAVLEREGLSPLDSETRVSQRGQSARVQDEAAPTGFLSWARDVLDTHAFDCPRDKAVWELYAAGKTQTEILEQLPFLPGAPGGRRPQELRLHRKAIERSIARVKRSAPPQPIANPWIKNPRLRDLEYRRMTEKEETMKPQQTRQPIEYASIQLKTEGLDVPGLSRKGMLVPMKDHRNIVQPLMGIPHAGGIDVLNLPTKDPKNPNRSTYTTVTVPWGSIKVAVHVPLDREEVETAA